MELIVSEDGFVQGEIVWNGQGWTARAWFQDEAEMTGEMTRVAPTHDRARCALRELFIRVRRNFRGTIKRRKEARLCAWVGR